MILGCPRFPPFEEVDADSHGLPDSLSDWNSNAAPLQRPLLHRLPGSLLGYQQGLVVRAVQSSFPLKDFSLPGPITPSQTTAICNLRGLTITWTTSGGGTSSSGLNTRSLTGDCHGATVFPSPPTSSRDLPADGGPGGTETGRGLHKGLSIRYRRTSLSGLLNVI